MDNVSSSNNTSSSFNCDENCHSGKFSFVFLLNSFITFSYRNFCTKYAGSLNRCFNICAVSSPDGIMSADTRCPSNCHGRKNTPSSFFLSTSTSTDGFPIRTAACAFASDRSKSVLSNHLIILFSSKSSSSSEAGFGT